MAIELIAAIVAAFGVGGIVFALRKLTRGRVPKWAVPAAAGLAMAAYAIWSEYDWYGRNAAGLPPGVEVAWTQADPSPLRPWTFAFPFVSKFGAIDTRAIAAHPAAPNLKMARVYVFGRWLAVRDAMMVFDCDGWRQVAVTDGMVISETGELSGAEWIAAPQDDGYQRAVCAAG